MPRQVSAAYVSLLLGFVCRGHEAQCEAALGTLGQPTFVPVADLLRSFLALHSSAQLLSEEGTAAMTAIIDWMSSYRVAGTSKAAAPEEAAAASDDDTDDVLFGNGGAARKRAAAPSRSSPRKAASQRSA